tara:strand:- start:1246 stop:1632 length:387 start_codon:yes stop_codon:yes gene_type:complete
MNVRAAFIYLFNVLVHNRPVLLLIGWLNRRWHFLTTIFVTYPATEDYARAYETPRGREIMRWSPWLVEFYRQNGKLGLSTVISSTEDQFRDPENAGKLQAMVNEAHVIGDLVGASQAFCLGFSMHTAL